MTKIEAIRIILDSSLRADSKVKGIDLILVVPEEQAESIVRSFVLPGDLQAYNRKKAALKGWQARRAKLKPARLRRAILKRLGRDKSFLSQNPRPNISGPKER